MSDHPNDFSDLDCATRDVDVDHIPCMWPVDDHSTLGVVIDPISGRLLLAGDDSLGEFNHEIRALRPECAP